MYLGTNYDSTGELDFFHWCIDARKHGYIENFAKCEKGLDTMELIGKQYYTKGGIRKHCFASVGYTPDFVIHGLKEQRVLEKEIDGDYLHYIDIKPAVSKYNDKKQFQIIRKMVLHFKGIYIHRITPDDLFLATWVPEACRYTEVKKNVIKKFRKTPTVKEFFGI